MSYLYRLAAHRLLVLDPMVLGQRLLDSPMALREVETRLGRLAPELGNLDIAKLRALLGSAWCQFPSIDAPWRVLSRDLGLTTGEPSLQRYFRAYQRAGAVLLHTTWLSGGQADVALFARRVRMLQRVPHFSQVELGVAYLWTVAVAEGHLIADEDALIRAILEEAGGSTRRPPVRLPGMTLFADPLDRLHEAPLQDVALFDSPAVEQSPAVRYLTLDAWPLWCLVRLRLRHVYRIEHRQRLRPLLKEASDELGWILNDILGQREGTDQPKGADQPTVLVRPRLDELQDAVKRLGRPQYLMLERLAKAEEWLKAARLELENLERSMASTVDALQQQAGGARSTGPYTELNEALAASPRHDLGQMDVDLLRFRHLKDRTASAVQILATQTEILEAGYERRLNRIISIISVVGVALAVGEIVDEKAAEAIYCRGCLGLGRLWEALRGLPPTQSPDGLALLFVRISIIIIIILVALVWLLYKLVRWSAWRVLASLRARD
jgi:hypothetical protein